MLSQNEIKSDLTLKENLQFVSFNLDKEEFAIDINFIQEIIKILPTTPVPLTNPYVTGVINIRGNIIPVINLRKRMDFEEKEITENTRIIVINFENRKIGIIVDNMNEVLKVSRENIQENPDNIENENSFSDEICVLGERIITILNLNRILEI